MPTRLGVLSTGTFEGAHYGGVTSGPHTEKFPEIVLNADYGKNSQKNNQSQFEILYTEIPILRIDIPAQFLLYKCNL